MAAPDKSLQRTRRAERKAERERAAAEEERAMNKKRQSQLAIAATAIDRLDSMLAELGVQESARDELMDHATGFYEEIDKLAKGKALLAVTELMVERANDIISVAKAIASGDRFLDRVKEFVPAGDNPVYPDVVVSIRAVLQALGRAKERMDSKEEQLGRKLGDAQTIHTALELLEEIGHVPLKEDVKRAAFPRDIVESWFEYDGGVYLFTLERLDRLDLEQYLSVDDPTP